MTKADAKDAAKIHCEALSGDFLPSLGESFLTTLYKCIIGLNVGFGIVYEKDDRIVGIAVATEHSRLFFKKLFLWRFWALTPKILFSILKHPALIKRTLETLFISTHDNDVSGTDAELLVIVLHSAYRRQRIGTKLINAVNKEFSHRRILNYAVKTYADNKESNIFYINNHFKYHNSYLMYNLKWNIYKLDLVDYQMH